MVHQHTAIRCNTLQHTATHFNTLQQSTTRCNTLQHAATRSCSKVGFERHGTQCIESRANFPVAVCCCSVLLQCVVAVCCCSVLQCVAVCSCIWYFQRKTADFAVCFCSLLQCVMVFDTLSEIEIFFRQTKFGFALSSLWECRSGETHCNKLQHAATYCNILQLTVTHCSTL